MRKLLSLIAALPAILVGLLVLGPSAPASAAEPPDCYGFTCADLDPASTNCVNDAKTIGAMNVNGDGMLELRWSRSCNASWGRFSTYRRAELYGSLTDSGISYARVTAWNPYHESKPVAGSAYDGLTHTWWTAMVSGSVRSCTGVELVAQDGSPTGNRWYTANRSLGWTWGPCHD